MSRLIVGQEEVIDGVLTALMCGGHVLLEGVPGLGKTMLVRSLGEALNLKFLADPVHARHDARRHPGHDGAYRNRTGRP